MIKRVSGIRNYKLLEFSQYITTVKFCSLLLEEHPITENQTLKKNYIKGELNTWTLKQNEAKNLKKEKKKHCKTSKLHLKGNNKRNSPNNRPYCPGSFRKITERKLGSGLGGIADSGIWWEVHRLAPAGTAEFWRHSADTGVLGALNHIYEVLVLYFKELVINTLLLPTNKNKKAKSKKPNKHTHNSTHKNVQICNIFFHSWLKKKNTTVLPQTPLWYSR